MPGRSATLVIGQPIGSLAKKDRREAAQRGLSYSSTVVLHILVHSGSIFRAPYYFERVFFFFLLWGEEGRSGFRIRFLQKAVTASQAKDKLSFAGRKFDRSTSGASSTRTLAWCLSFFLWIASVHQPQSHAREIWVLLPLENVLFDLIVCLLVVLDAGLAGLAFFFFFWTVNLI